MAGVTVNDSVMSTSFTSTVYVNSHQQELERKTLSLISIDLHNEYQSV